MKLITTPEPPYYAVIFSSIRTEVDENYHETNEQLEQIAQEVDGYLGIESARNENGITVSYWRDLESIQQWRDNIEHQKAKVEGRKKWYYEYYIRICKVERDYRFEK